MYFMEHASAAILGLRTRVFVVYFVEFSQNAYLDLSASIKQVSKYYVDKRL